MISIGREQEKCVQSQSIAALNFEAMERLADLDGRIFSTRIACEILESFLQRMTSDEAFVQEKSDHLIVLQWGRIDLEMLMHSLYHLGDEAQNAIEAFKAAEASVDALRKAAI